MARDAPIFGARPARGRQADRVAAALAALGLALSVLTTAWFLAGFVETDPDFRPASSAFLLSLLLGAFAIVPCAVTMRLAWSAWRNGFRIAHGIWTLVLFAPWILLGILITVRSPLPISTGLIATGLSTLLTLWAAISIVMERTGRETD